jgi:hypothetical protein
VTQGLAKAQSALFQSKPLWPVSPQIDVIVKLTPLLATPPTVTTTFPVLAPVGTEVTMVVEFQLVVVAVVPLNLTVPEDPKFVPVIVTALPTVPDVGFRLVIEGADPVTVKAAPLLATPPTVTTTFPVVASDGTDVTMLVELHFVVVAAVPLNVTVPDDPKFVPVIVTCVPTAPEVGDRLVMLGAGGPETNKIVSEMDWELVPTVAVTVADCDALTTAADAVKVAVGFPEATVNEAGTASAVGLLFVNETFVPPEGAG